MKKRLIGLGVAILLTSSQTIATTFFEEKFVCPVGGEKFTGLVIGSYTTWGQRPDGRPIGTLPVHPIVECPKNGMLLFDDSFTAPELQVLESVVPSAEYQAMRKTETPHYRVWWLMTKIGRDPYAQAWQLLQASWESDENWERKVRYQVAFVNHTAQLKRDDRPTGKDKNLWFMYKLRTANALRELGHFDKALALLAELDKPEFLPADPEDAAGTKKYIENLKVLSKEGNPSPEPANMIPADSAAYRCELAGEGLTASERPVCEDPKLAPLRANARKVLDRKKS